MTPSSRLRRAVSATLATVTVATGLATVTTGSASAEQLHTPAQCAAALSAATAGQPIPAVASYRGPRSLITPDRQLRIAVSGDNPRPGALTQSIADWNRALAGRVTLRQVAPGEEADVTVLNLPGPVGDFVGRASASRRSIEIHLGALSDRDARMALNHETGHMLGLDDTGCVGTLMHGYSDQQSVVPTPLDVAAVVQGRY
ncbi:hypothetical protein [Corynebacterium bovis]|uniref:hypothetical protein n=1 Tax=Corynebacterium bovis TaxID=36808 RepID=UPI00254F0DEF|nr:hypothetical protein [Corynebacterium bovis]MDK8511827.1 hypothetical protein [Corynebacterium bovis]